MLAQAQTRKAELYASWMPRSPRWYVAAIMAGYETTAIEHCSRQGFELYVPMLVDRQIVNGKHAEIRRPRFRGYGFVPLDLDQDQWRSVNGTRGVRHLLPKHDTERPLPLPIGFIEKLISEPERVDEVLAEFSANDLVRIVAGKLLDQLVTVRAQREPGADVLVELPNGFLTRVSALDIEHA